MGPKYISFCYFAFVCGHILSMTLEAAWFTSGDVDWLNSLVGYNVVELSAAGVWAIPKALTGFFLTGVPRMITWDYSFFYGNWELFRIILMGAISVGAVWGLTVTFASFMFGVAQKILGWFGW